MKVITNQVDPFNVQGILDYYHNSYYKFAPANIFDATCTPDHDRVNQSPKVSLLEDMFVEPAVSLEYVDAERIVNAENGSMPVVTAYSVPPLIQKLKHIIILADPGMGKSSLMQWLWLSYSRSNGGFSYQNEQFVPFIFRLDQDLQQKQAINSWDSLWRVCKSVNKLPKQTWPEEWLASGRAIILIDGVDELFEEIDRNNIADAIIEGVTRYPACKFVITSRIVGYDVISSKIERYFRPFYLLPFDESRQKSFAKNWISYHIGNEHRHKEVEQKLTTQLSGISTVAQLARIPFFLNLICFIFTRKMDMPRGLVELFEIVDKLYLSTLDQTRGEKFGDKQLSLDSYDLRNMLAMVAFNMQDEGRTSVDRELVLNKFSEYITNRTSGNIEQIKRECEFILKYISHRSGLFIDFGQNNFSFIHRSFQEYFAARHLSSFLRTKSMTDKIESAWISDDSWHEVFIKTFELFTNIEEADDAIDIFFSDVFDVMADKREIGCLFAQIIMNQAVRLSSKKRRECIEISWRALGKSSLFKPVTNVFVWRERLRWLKTLWHDRFDSLKIFQEICKDKDELALTGYWIENIDFLLGLSHLRKLSLISTQVTDFTSLETLTGLEELDLRNNRIRSASFLKSLPNLSTLSIRGTQITTVKEFPEKRDKELMLITDSMQIKGNIPEYVKLCDDTEIN